MQIESFELFKLILLCQEAVDKAPMGQLSLKPNNF